ncbi:hypothetical protein BC941DRAFT_436869 [Chlamydoabsidia padenii]|nr:hypothetical protein BC941DRAFT_436869 [Chlamydoabsidia padenii]
MATLHSSALSTTQTASTLRLHTNDLTVDASHPAVPPSPYSMTSLQVHEDTASLASSSTTSTSHHPSDKPNGLNMDHTDFKKHHLNIDDDLFESSALTDSSKAMEHSTGIKHQEQSTENKRREKKYKDRTGDKVVSGNNNTLLTLSAIRSHDAGHRNTTKEAVVLAWIDNVAQAPTLMNETSHIIDLDQPSHYKIADAAAASAVSTDQDDASTTMADMAPIQETKDVFTDTQKMAYVGLCAVTSLEVVHDLKGKDFTYARMSADNWQRKLMRMIYMHMDISPEEIKMIESLSKHDILPTDFVYQFTAQGETATVNVKDLHGHPTTKQQPSTTYDKVAPPSPLIQPLTISDNNTAMSASTPTQSSTESDSDNTVPVSPPQQTSTTHDSDTSKTTTIEYTHSASLEEEEDSSMGVDDDNRDDTTISTTAPPDLSTLPPLPPSSLLTASSVADTTSTSPCSDDPSSHMDKYEAPEHFVIDLRWTVMCDLFLICLSLENYDARSRVFIHRMANYLSLDWTQVLSFERRITEHLLQVEGAWETQSSVTVSTTISTSSSTIVDPSQLSNTKERTSRNNQRKKRRYVMIGLATIGGGLILGLSAGFMAPVIAGGLGALLTTVGVSGTSAFLGGATGIGLITSAATVAGGRLGAISMNRRMKSIGTFDFLPIHVNHQASCIISVTGWLPKSDSREEAATLPFGPLDSVMGDHYTLFWEPEMLEELGSAFKIFATEAVTFSVQQALGHTIMGALLAGLAWPLALTKLGYLVDNPWANGLDRAKSAGLILADVLMNRNLGARPVTLVGYSLGARVIFYCLLELARVNAYGLVEDVALFGTPVSASKAQWRDVTSIVAGRVVNGYATNDWLLGFLFRATNAGSTLVGNNVAGLHALEMIEGDRVQNLDCTDLIKGHLSYRMAMPKLLKRAGFIVTKEDIVEKKEKDTKKKSGSQPDVDSSRKSSLSSGTASIQLPSKTLAAVAMENSLSANAGSSSSTTSKESMSSPSSSTMVQPNSIDDTQRSLDNATTQPSTPSATTTSLVQGVSDMDIIADIIANATAAAASKSGTYSSMSSGKASITTTPPASATGTPKSSKSRTSGFFGFSRSRSETTSAIEPIQQQEQQDTTTPIKSRSSSSSATASSFWSRNIKKNSIPPQPTDDVEIEIKEIKTTLGKMVVPSEVIHPMPKINLEMPQHARINR